MYKCSRELRELALPHHSLTHNYWWSQTILMLLSKMSTLDESNRIHVAFINSNTYLHVQNECQAHALPNHCYYIKPRQSCCLWNEKDSGIKMMQVKEDLLVMISTVHNRLREYQPLGGDSTMIVFDIHTQSKWPITSRNHKDLII